MSSIIAECMVGSLFKSTSRGMRRRCKSTNQLTNCGSLMVEGVIVVQRYDSRFEMLITAVDAQGSR
jgi:hypothetical protein